MATALGFVRLRRGILEHLTTGRISADEFAGYTVIILKADHRTGVWKGSGALLARLLHWGRTKAWRVLKSLAAKGYLSLVKLPYRTGFLAKISKYFGDGTVSSQSNPLLQDATVPPLPPCSRMQHREQEELLNQQEEIMEKAPASFSRLFWERYPEGNRGPYIEVQREWTLIPLADKNAAEILLGLEAWKGSARWRDPQFIPQARNFLKRQYWKQIPPQEQSNGNGQRHRQAAGAIPRPEGKRYPTPTVIRV